MPRSDVQGRGGRPPGLMSKGVPNVDPSKKTADLFQSENGVLKIAQNIQLKKGIIAR